MLNSRRLLNPKSLICKILLLLGIFLSCQKEEEDIFDAIFSEHKNGTGYFYTKYLNTLNGQWIEERDTFYDQVLTLTRLNSTQFKIEGYAAADIYDWISYEGWDSSDTLVGYDYYQGGKHYQLKIDLIERTIKTYFNYDHSPHPDVDNYRGEWSF